MSENGNLSKPPFGEAVYQTLHIVIIYDNIWFAYGDDYRHLEEYAKTRTNSYGVSFEDVCREVMGKRQRNELRKLIGFQFKRHPSINLPEEHLEAIEKQVNLRVRELLALPRR